MLHLLPFILLISLLHKVFSYEVNLEERFDFYDYDNYVNEDRKPVYTGSTIFNNNYYSVYDYFYQVIPSKNKPGIYGFLFDKTYRESCLDTCKDLIVDKDQKKNIVGVIGFNVTKLRNNFCECKGTLLKVNSFSYYPYILNIKNYNTNFHELGEEIFENSTKSITSSAKSNCYDSLMKIIKLVKAEAYTDYKLNCDEKLNKCTCSAKPLTLKP